MEGFCRGCLKKYNEPMELLQYTEKNRRLFVYITGLQVKRNDAFTFQLCKDCFLNMKLACKFKKLCRTSDKRFKNYLALKDLGDPVDFCTFLKNSDDTMTFRLPMASGNSTPANHKCKDDDNESTCTSIRNFMTDILQGEEVPEAEAQIIREIIEEEAHVLDDSLDSHWLQDDMSIDTDFRLDFSFSAFSTPRTVNNDRCYTPKKLTQRKEEQTKIPKDFTNAFNGDLKVKELCNFGAEEINAFKKPENSSLTNVKELCNHGIEEINSNANSEKNTHKSAKHFKELFDLNLIDKSESDSQKNNQSLIELCDLSISDTEKSGSNASGIIKEICDFNINQTDGFKESKMFKQRMKVKSLKELCDFSVSDIDDIAKSESNGLKNEQNIKELCRIGIDQIDGTGKPKINIGLPSLDDLDKNKINIQTNYIPINDIGLMQSNNHASNSSINIEALLKDKPCTIDRNMEEALKNAGNKEFSLEDLLVSPPGLQGASTPTITNILFGEKLDSVYSNITPKDDMKLKTFDDVQCDIEIFEEFFQNDTKEFDIENIKTENVDIKTEDTTGLDDMEVDYKDVINMFKLPEIIPKEIDITTQSYDELFNPENSYCKLCRKKFGSSRALSIHFAKRHNIKIIRQKPKLDTFQICNKCGKEFKNNRNFSRHFKNCLKPQDIFKCDRCPVECSTPATLKKHMKSHFPKIHARKATGKQYVCPVCGASMNKLYNFELHLRRHSKSYTVHCEECGKGFYRPSELTSHIRMHTGDTPFACKLCPRLFARKDVLARHVHIHMGEKFYECNDCGYKCTHKHDLKRHIFKKTSCNRKKLIKIEKKTENKTETPLTEQVTVIYAAESNEAIKKQLPFLETDRSN